MKKVLGLFAIALSLVSCSAEEIEMRTINPQLGVDVVGKWFLNVENEHPTNEVETSTVTIKFNPTENKLLIDGNSYEVKESTHYTITYIDGSINKVIEFNEGYVFDGGSTQTKFSIYEDGKKKQKYKVYTYNN